MKIKDSIIEIGVASYNEVEALAVSITNLIQCKTYFKSVGINLQIHISDNCSNQMGISRIKKLCLENQIRFSRNSHNIGFAGNLLKLLKNSDSKYILILGCGETLDQYSLHDLNRILTEYDSNKVYFKFGVVSENREHNSANSSENFETLNVLRVNGAISLNIWNTEIIEYERLPPKILNDWPHIELAAVIDSKHPQLNSFHFHKPLVKLYQPINGWYTSDDFLTILLRLDLLIDKFPNISIGKKIENNVRITSWWIYNYRLVTNRRISVIKAWPLLVRVKRNPIGLLHFITISQTPIILIRLILKIRKKFIYSFIGKM
jgi:hypothetical protein